MKCAFCNTEYDEASQETACNGCALFGGCKKTKCPRCGYEAPAEPGLVKWIRKHIRKSDD